MSFFRRAFLHTIRQPVKSLTIFLVLLTASTLLLATVAVRESAEKTSDDLGSQLLAGFSIQNNLATNPGTSRGAGTIPKKDIDALAELPDITEYVAKMNATADVRNGEIFKLEGGQDDYSKAEEAMFGNTVPVNAVSRSDLETAFRAGTFTLSAGRHIAEQDHHVALVHEDFAKKNHLSIGDKLELTANAHDDDNRFKSTASVSPTIIGTFSGTNSGIPRQRLDLYQNAVFTDLDTARTLNGTTPENEIYQSATFFVDTVGDVDQAMTEARSLPINWNLYTLAKNADQLGGIGAAADGITSLLRTVTIGTAGFTVAALGLVLYLWLSQRKQETGVLLSIGQSKAAILGQYISENLLVFILALVTSLGTSHLLAQSLADSIVGRASSEATERLNAGQTFADDFATSTIQKSIDHVTVHVEPQFLLTAGALGIALVVVATIVAASPMLVRQPKKLLTQIG